MFLSHNSLKYLFIQIDPSESVYYIGYCLQDLYSFPEMSGFLELFGQNGDDQLGVGGGEADDQGEDVFSVEGVEDEEQVYYL